MNCSLKGLWNTRKTSQHSAEGRNRLMRVLGGLEIPIGRSFLVLLALCSTVHPSAAEEYTVEIAGYYAHPTTGIIEDSGGEANHALGQSMVAGVVDSVGLLETDLDGNLYLSVTFHLMDSISDVSIQVQESGADSWETVAHETVEEGNDQATFQVALPSQNAILRGSLFVLPMGRSVVFYMAAGNATAGNTTAIPAIKQNVSGSSTPSTPSTSTTTTSTTTTPSDTTLSGDGLILSTNQSSSNTTSQSTSTSQGTWVGESDGTGGLSVVEFILIIVAANLVSGAMLCALLFMIMRVKRTEATLEELVKIHAQPVYLRDISGGTQSKQMRGRLPLDYRLSESDPDSEEPPQPIAPKVEEPERSEEEWAELIAGKDPRKKEQPV